MQAGKREKKRLRLNVTVIICMVALIVSLAGIIIGYWRGFLFFKEIVSRDQKEMAEMLAASLSRIVTEEVRDLYTYSNSPLWGKLIKEHGSRYEGMYGESFEKFCQDADEKWQNLSFDEMLNTYLSTSLAERLSSIVKHDDNISEIFVTDEKGGLVASSGKTSDFFQADEEWWQQAYNSGEGGVFISDVEYDESAGVHSISIAVPIKNDKGEIIGISKSVLDVMRFFEPLGDFKIGKEGHALLAKHDNTIIFHKGVKAMQEKLMSIEDAKGLAETGRDLKGIVIKYPHHNEKMFISSAEIKNPYLLERGIRWRVYVSQPVKEVIAPAWKLAAQAASLIPIEIIIMIPLGIFFSGLLIKPIKKLNTATLQVSNGNMDFPIDIKTNDEIEELADSFKIMVDRVREREDRLKIWAKELEGRVAERTRELSDSQKATLNILEDVDKAKKQLEGLSKGLEEKVKEKTFELSTLYEVSNAISYVSDYQQVLKLVMEAIAKVVDYDICAALLFDAESVNIAVRPAYLEAEKLADTIKASAMDSVSKLTGQDMHSRNINLFAVPADYSAKKQASAKCDKLSSFLNAPLTASGGTIGILTLASCADNAFSEDNSKIVNAIATQASNAVERIYEYIAAEKSKLKTMVENMIEGVIMLDEKGDIAVFNPKAKEMLGFDPNADIPRKAFEEKAKAFSLYNAIVESNTTKQLLTKELIMPHEISNILRCDINPVVSSEKDEILGTVIVIRDITKEKEIDRMKTDFISTVSHELRTPLSITKEGISLVMDEIPGAINEKQLKILTTSRDNIDRLARIINNLLDISKIEAGKMELKREVIKMSDLIRKAAHSFELKIQNRKIQLRLNLPQDDIEVYVDPDRIIQVFTNLLSNSLKFTEQGFIDVSLKDKNDAVECSISDTGIGISKDDLPKIFSKFEQFGRVAGPGEKGTGLGLSIVKGIIDEHQGYIEADSKIGQGTTFTFTLPKYTSASVISKRVGELIIRSAQSKTSMALLVVSIEEPNKMQADIRKESLLGDVEKLFKDTLRMREGDLALRGRDKLTVILADCSKDNAFGIEKRFRSILDKHLEDKGLNQKVKLRFSVAAYPVDAKDAGGLIAKAEETQV